VAGLLVVLDCDLCGLKRSDIILDEQGGRESLYSRIAGVACLVVQLVKL
jgi:hypothetical protein